VVAEHPLSAQTAATAIHGAEKPLQHIGDFLPEKGGKFGKMCDCAALYVSAKM
jgi:hypothetical protein